VLATVVDALVPLAVLVAQIVLPTPSSAVRWSLWAVFVAWLGVLVVTEGITGRTPGKALLGLRSVDVRTGRVMGLGAATIRTPVKLVAGVGTLAIAGCSYRWDPDGQERTWWDRVAGSRVIDASVQVPGGTRRSGVAPGAVDATAARWAPIDDRAPVVTGVPGVRPTSGNVPPAGPAVRPPASLAPATDPRLRQPVAPFQPATQPFAPREAVTRETVTRETESRETVSREAITRQIPSGQTGVRHAAPGGPMPAQPTRVESSPTAVGWGHAGLPPGPPGVVDDPAAETIAAAGLQDPTRVHSRDELGALPARVPGRPTTATLQWDTGARVVVGGAVLIGRDPIADDGEKVDRRLAVGRDSVGVSKTHLLLSITTAGVTVTDRHSTNGVRLEHEDGTTEKCRADVATPVRGGDVIRFGGRSITLPSD
jgi:hypothetical protein